MIDDFANQWIKKFEPGLVHKVSEKTVTVRMWVFLTVIMPSIYDSVETDGDRVLALYRAHKLDTNLLSVAMQRGTPLNTLLTYIEKFNVACYDIINKDVGSWDIDE